MKIKFSKLQTLTKIYEIVENPMQYATDIKFNFHREI